MDIKTFKAGTYKKGYEYSYFMPSRINHSFVWSDKTINELLEAASLRVGELNAFSCFVPDTDMFIRMHILKEAVLSSRIEGTQTNIEEAIAEEAHVHPEKRDDWREVNSYVAAMNAAIKELSSLPLSNRLIKNTHKVLMSNVRGKHKFPGEFRQSQNWIGGASLSDAVFIPPAQEELSDLLTDFEMFLHNTEIKVPHLVKIAIAHYQFETIHPFLDGNGRVGRLLITLYLVSNKVLGQPLLYLSDFFDRNKSLYYDNLTFARTKNDLTQWIKFFLTGIIQTAESGVATLKRIMECKARIEKESILEMGKRAKPALVLFHHLFRKPVVSIKEVKNLLEISAKSSSDLVKIFVEKKILVEITGMQRNRLFAFQEYIRMF